MKPNSLAVLMGMQGLCIVLILTFLVIGIVFEQTLAFLPVLGLLITFALIERHINARKGK